MIALWWLAAIYVISLAQFIGHYNSASSISYE